MGRTIIDTMKGLLLALLITWPAASWGGAGAERLQEFLDETRAFDATFVQDVRTPDWGSDERRTGIFQAEKPGRFRWDYDEPFDQSIISDGETVWYYEPELKQATRVPWSRLEKSPAAFLSAGGDLAETFQILEITNKRLNLPAVRLIPKNREESVQEITVTLRPDKPEIAELEMVDSIGNRSLFTFDGMKRNGPIDPDRFRFTPPEGVDVVEPK